MKLPGYLFVLGGSILVRQVAIGRAQETPEDIRDMTLAVLNADMDEVKTVLSRRGTNVEAAVSSGVVAADNAAASTSSSDKPLVQTVMNLGNAANGYRLGATGPDYYDCSGLIWRACKNLGLYNGPRFTTHTFQAISRGWAQNVDTQTIGSIVLWSSRHMGICIGNDRMYSARSTAKGIGESTISGDSGYFGRQPTYWVVN
jgi:cell wall-associated NlpC family hydrolase